MKILLEKTNVIAEKIQHELFEKKIDKKKQKFERRHNYKMDDDEINKYKFNLFIGYAFVLVVPIILLFSLF